MFLAGQPNFRVEHGYFMHQSPVEPSEKGRVSAEPD